MKAYSVVVVLAACGSPTEAPDAPLAPPPDAAPLEGVDISAELAPIAAQYGLPALAALAADDVVILGRGVTGVRKVGDPTLATLHDRWHLGSDTKAMTATVIARAVEQGKLSWDTKVPALFPGVTVHPGYADATLAMLLAHVGGAPPDLPPDVFQAMAQPGPSRMLRDQAVRTMLSRPPGASVGTFAYSNAGYMFAGAALERALDAPWEQLVDAMLFVPLGMNGCGFGPNASGNSVDAPWGHLSDNGNLVPLNVDNPPALGPAGTVHCPLVDWLAFLREHLHGARGEATTLGLAPATWTRLHTPPAGGDYALGWGLAERDWSGGAPALTHIGSNTLNVADVWLAPAIRRIYIAVGNRGDDMAITGADAAVFSLVTRFPGP